MKYSILFLLIFFNQVSAGEDEEAQIDSLELKKSFVRQEIMRSLFEDPKYFTESDKKDIKLENIYELFPEYKSEKGDFQKRYLILIQNPDDPLLKKIQNDALEFVELKKSKLLANDKIETLEKSLEFNKITPKEKQYIHVNFHSLEPNVVGYTLSGDDRPFMDFKVSIKWNWVPYNSNWPRISNTFKPYLAFTGRAGQYIKTRRSSPIIGKRFNPFFGIKIHLSDYFSKKDARFSVDFTTGHESNGQYIDSLSIYQARNQTEITQNEDQSVNDSTVWDFVSRGWDFVGGNFNYSQKMSFGKLMVFFESRYFLPEGRMQGKAENIHSWENIPKSKTRIKYDGLRLKFRYDFKKLGIRHMAEVKKVFFNYTTGMADFGDNNTYRGEVSVKLLGMPLVVSGGYGYGNDLARYFQQSWSAGLALELETYMN